MQNFSLRAHECLFSVGEGCVTESYSQWDMSTEAVDLNSIVHSDESRVTAVRGVCLETPLVYPSVADKHTNCPIQAFCRGLPPHKAAVASPSAPPPPRQATGGMLRLVFSHSSQAAGLQRGWNMIGPLSKHALYHGCVQGRTDSGNASNWGKVLPRPAEPGCTLMGTAFARFYRVWSSLRGDHVLAFFITGDNNTFTTPLPKTIAFKGDSLIMSMFKLEALF